MSLIEELTARRKASRNHISPDKLSVMDRATQNLAQSGITASCLKAGDAAPDFVLPNAAGQWVSLMRILKDGPAVLSFYRGGW